MVWQAVIYIALVLFVPCGNSQDRENWAAVRWGLFYSTHFWYAATLTFWAFSSVDIHTYPTEVYQQLLKDRQAIETAFSRYVGFFHRVIGTMDDDSNTEGIMYLILIAAAVFTWLAMGVSISTQIYGTGGSTGKAFQKKKSTSLDYGVVYSLFFFGKNFYLTIFCVDLVCCLQC
ncbi:hypothetical protein RFI_16445 [Reticulomyxa filosa]|uniref:Uncharacterized protein n=1 Tax=Reticulomyxa filosa TaxID=46433 RepID=X6N406_RETFI|nr:hypothetical protein RFI_16445 [Reticulomyxa filosa]|eukprot:ETO20771.1 hypothetical protein RFI_16445 [Reticulomyxa filosa]